MSKTILVIEDDAVIRNNISELLKIENYNVIEAENGGAGLGILRMIEPDLILCDINMPDFDGFQVLRYVRKDERLAKLPFLFLTARSDRQSTREGMNLGADDYISKPFTSEELLSAINARLDRHDTLMTYSSVDLDKAKKELTRLVAHELKTPLTSLVMIEQLISSRIDSLGKEQIQDLLESWKSGAHRLHHLVEQMVLLTQIDSDSLTSADVKYDGSVHSIASILEAGVAVARQFAYRHPHGRIDLNPINHNLFIRCHHKSLCHAFAEIVSNALDFSPEGTVVRIALGKQSQSAIITIVDEGPGLTTKRLERAMLPFQQIDRQKQEQQGMGLGLPLAKKIIEIHRGAIAFRKVASGGTQVIIQLPLN